MTAWRPTPAQLQAIQGDAEWIREGIDRLIAALLEHRVVPSDMHVGNIVHGHSGSEPPRFVPIDGCGD